jgi:hypothetical protein
MTSQPTVDLVADTAATFAQVAQLPAEDKVRAAKKMWTQILSLQAACAKLSTSGVREMRAAGQTYRQIAALLGLSVTRVRQIEDLEPAPKEEALNGS